jgi:hypothetical protein
MNKHVLYCNAVKLAQKNCMTFLLIFILSYFTLFLLIFKVILFIIFTIFLGHQNPGPGHNKVKMFEFLIIIHTEPGWSLRMLFSQE